ncbi:hypothetical protein [Amycolatopsis nalaikhensis]|uniref:Uncharacterized protein n=1 Tax=Amycolatopsis nalaikhensis TaxID=715472 RepID=A0ABY8XLF9_9PSEU|nr:hypothetical protein [Amycolatopsis sp. 2-2]WIV56395.1 hypothetical protein QP939_47670 [Amycolatopsis sp. 2-2]
MLVLLQPGGDQEFERVGGQLGVPEEVVESPTDAEIVGLSRPVPPAMKIIDAKSAPAPAGIPGRCGTLRNTVRDVP